MVACVKCNEEMEYYWTEVRVQVGSSKAVPVITKVGVCKKCGNEVIFLGVEPLDDKILIRGYDDGKAQ